MRDFFKQTLQGLPSAGIRQMEFLTLEQTTQLLDDLCIVSEKKFGYIPTEVQKAEIRKQIIEDPDFNGLNTRVLFKWLSKIATKFWNERNAKEEETMVEPASPEVAAKYLEEWKKALDNVILKYSPEGKNSGSRLRESLGQEKALSVGVIKNWEVGEACENCDGSGVLHSSAGNSIVCDDCKGIGEINRATIPATSIEEARKAYQLTFK